MIDKKCSCEPSVENLENGCKRYTCNKCGLDEVRDSEGKKLLVGQKPLPAKIIKG